MKNKLFSFIKLSQAEKVFFLRALLLLSVYRIRLQTSSLEDLIKLVQKKSKSPHTRKGHTLPLHQASKLIQVAVSLVPFSTCLSNALAGQILFTTHQHATRLHIGVRNTPSTGFEAHAWLTLDGTILLGHLPDLKTYKELPSILQEETP